MNTDKIPKRNEVPKEYTWNLADIFESDAAWFCAYEDLKTYPPRFHAFEGKLCGNAQNLLSYYRLCDEADLKISRLDGYAFCKHDEDTADNYYQDMRSKAYSMHTQLAESLSFADTELLELSDEALNGFYRELPELKEYERSIEKVLRNRTHILSKEAERVLALSADITSSPEEINGILTDAEFRFEAVKDKNGVGHPLTDASFVPLLMSHDSVLRQNTFKTYYQQYGAYKNTLAATLDGQFKALKFHAQARNYEDCLSAALFDNEVPVSVYTRLIEAVHANLDKMYRYVALRKKALGVQSLHMYDVYVPIIENASCKIGFEEAKQTVLNALSVLGEDYVNLLKTGFENRWIDVYENEGKRSGAYSSSNCLPHPYVLLNHKDDLDSVFTLAHEMGHALHSYYSRLHQPTSNADYVIFVAEVASTCNEILLMQYLLNTTQDKKQRAYFINHFLDQFKGTVFRQTMFAEFELTMAKMCENNEALTADALSEKYLSLNRLYFGEDMISDPEIALEWARIPHFFYNFYVYQYATGFCAAAAIAKRILQLGEPAVRDYKRFLSAGGSADPITLLKLAGVDMSTPQPVNDALMLFDELITELAELI